MKQYYLVSLKHTHEKDFCLTLWGKNGRGYTWFKRGAGLYTHNEALVLQKSNPEHIKMIHQTQLEPLFLTVGYEGENEECIPNSEGVLAVLGIKKEDFILKHKSTSGIHKF